MYTLVLIFHSWVRWVALVAGIGATLAAINDPGVTTNARADRWGLVLMIALDIQMLVGLLLYVVLSPFTTEAMQDLAAAMRNPQLRFWAVDHVSTMFLAVILVHVGRVLARKAPTPKSKQLRLGACFAFATMAMLFAMPWPGLPNGRPLLRF